MQATNTAAPPVAAGESVLFTQSFSFKIPKNMDGVSEIFSVDGQVSEKALVYATRAHGNQLRKKTKKA